MNGFGGGQMIFGQCDACGAPNRVLHQTIAYGIETCACDACFGNPLSDAIDDLQDEIETLTSTAETPEQFAHIRALEAALVEATA